MLNTRALFYLSAINRRGSLRRAASMSGVDVSTVSRKIRQLEEILDVTLLERGASGTILTEAGRLLAQHHHKQEASEAAILSHLNELQGVVAGWVRIAVGEGFVSDLMLEPLGEFMAENPGVKVEISVSGVDEATDLLKSGDVDLAILYAPPVDHMLECHAETIQPIDLIVPADHPFSRITQPLSFQEIAKHPIGLMDPSFGLRQMLDAVAHQQRVVFEAQLLTNSVNVLRHYVCSGRGITFMPELTVAQEISAGTLVAIPLEHNIFSSTRAQIASLVDRERTIATQCCLDYLRAKMRFFNADAPRLIRR
ncbi:LysR family transcriptional regulator [Shimia sediminis]|uniref:LysR family transcriptional regulator n=1 Tax=Shimia sediminis TaxID=2497945 RepID=UPI000F8DD0EE|nr:LysR family transcriptional regulator [Shimia sediminis]